MMMMMIMIMRLIYTKAEQIDVRHCFTYSYSPVTDRQFCNYILIVVITCYNTYSIAVTALICVQLNCRLATLFHLRSITDLKHRNRISDFSSSSVFPFELLFNSANELMFLLCWLVGLFVCLSVCKQC